MGMVLQAGAVIGSTSQRDEDLIIELNLPSAERAKVKIKDDVEMVVAGLNQSEYGIIEGRVISIAEDVTIDEKKNLTIYILKFKSNLRHNF